MIGLTSLHADYRYDETDEQLNDPSILQKSDGLPGRRDSDRQIVANAMTRALTELKMRRDSADSAAGAWLK